MNVGKQDLDSDTGTEEVSNLGKGDKVANVRAAGGRSAPVGTERTLILVEDSLDNVGAKHLVKTASDELEAIGSGQLHLGRHPSNALREMFCGVCGCVVV